MRGKYVICLNVSILILGILYFSDFSQQAHASHNPNLFTSAENFQFDNFFAGPMVIEVIVIDPAVDDTDEIVAEPLVTVNGKKHLSMVWPRPSF
jgi:hypothetical protein